MPSVKCLMASSWLPAAKAAFPLACSNNVIRSQQVEVLWHDSKVLYWPPRTLNVSDAMMVFGSLAGSSFNWRVYALLSRAGPR